ncbi:hypothetical protein M0R45_029616 [Rubus argutus]|uniref:F-box domain-containing protein n=1 Tax=Rubus argutus TaxID=59490 RepID=A0AAW1W9J0_RUBAR
MYVDVDKLTKDNRWSEHLPDDLVEMVVKRISLVDSIRFDAVCTSWRSVSSQWFQRATRVPWLMRAVKFLDSTSVQYKFYSPSEDRVYNLKFSRETKQDIQISILYFVKKETKGLHGC